MRIGIISDIHGNIEAAAAALDFLKDRVDVFVSPGDIVGYGPDPDDCVALVSEKVDFILKGNHEEGILTGDLSRFKKTAKIALEWTQERLSADSLLKLKALPAKQIVGDALFVHASITDPLFRYLLKKEDAAEEFAVLEEKVCFFGHTHMPGGFKMRKNGEAADVIYADFSGRLDIEIQEEFSYLVNVGSVGQPRDGFPFACAAIYDSEKGAVNLSRIEYPLEKTRKKIIERGLPSVLSRRIAQGI